MKFNIEQYKQDTYLASTGMDVPLEGYFDVYDFPTDLTTANGLSILEDHDALILIEMEDYDVEQELTYSIESSSDPELGWDRNAMLTKMEKNIL